jgi:hypothetical protein
MNQRRRQSDTKYSDAVSSAVHRFQPGERVVIREVLNGQVWTVRPVKILEDSDVHVVSWLAPGTLTDYPAGVEHGATCLNMWLSGEWRLEPKVFHPPGMLRIAPRDAPYEVFAPLLPEGGVQWWYVNFQRPLERTSMGFDTMDEILDLVVSADCGEWVRKDADELELAVAMGFLDRVDAKRISDACSTLEESLERGVVPWDHDAAKWFSSIFSTE